MGHQTAPSHTSLIWLALVVSILAIYAQVATFQFVDYDDSVYVYNNPHIKSGLTPATVKWAFTSVVSANWMPVTLLSHLTDFQLFRLRSGLHHLVNVFFHLLASGLLFAVFRRATGAFWQSAFVTFLFALHPLHVGSVAWIAERKDVLSACFFFLALYSYVLYTERPARGRYLAVLALFSLGLMAKPMLVTFPFVLLLFDVWPLRRFEWRRGLREKLPLFVLSAASSAITYWVQKRTGSVQTLPFALRVENALTSYVTYLSQTFWPAGLAVFYPYPQAIPAWHAAAALVMLLLISVLVVRVWKSRPYYAVGWFWYLGTLVPVIGVVQVGYQAHADRYTYLPMVGVAVMLAWGATDLCRKWPAIRPAMVAAAVASCLVCAVLAWKQTSYWENSETLFLHAIDVTGEDNWGAQSYLGEYLVKLPGRRADAIPHLEAALKIKPDLAEVSNNLGVCLVDVGLYGAAIPRFQAALRVKPEFAEASNNLGICLMNIGRSYEAVASFENALRVNPNNASAHRNLATLLARMGRTDESNRHLETAATLDRAKAEPADGIVH